MFNTVSNLSMSNNNMNQTVGNMRLRYWHGFFRMIKSTVLRLYLFVLLVLLCASVRYVRIEKNLTSFVPSYVPTYLPTYLSINLFIYQSVFQSIYLSIYLFIYLSTYQHIDEVCHKKNGRGRNNKERSRDSVFSFILLLSQWGWNASCQWCDLPLSQSVN